MELQRVSERKTGCGVNVFLAIFASRVASCPRNEGGILDYVFW